MNDLEVQIISHGIKKSKNILSIVFSFTSRTKHENVKYPDSIRENGRSWGEKKVLFLIKLDGMSLQKNSQELFKTC